MWHIFLLILGEVWSEDILKVKITIRSLIDWLIDWLFVVDKTSEVTYEIYFKVIYQNKLSTRTIIMQLKEDGRENITSNQCVLAPILLLIASVMAALMAYRKDRGYVYSSNSYSKYFRIQ